MYGISYWYDGTVTYHLLRPEQGPSECEWIVPGFWHEHE